jgi:hypothetical protein
MKKITSFLILLFAFVSCSAPENESAAILALNDVASRPGPVIGRLDPTKLARVIYYPGTDHERTWFFYPNGLLRKIVTPDGTLIQDFFYDANKNLTATHFYGDPYFIGDPYSYTFTYDISNHVTSANGVQITYNSSNNTYSRGTTTITLNPDLLMTGESYSYYEEEEPGEPPVLYTAYGVSAGYSNSNHTYHWEYDSPSATHYLHDTHVNPFRAALLPVSRVMGLLFFGNSHLKWMQGEHNSQNNIVKTYYESEDPESDRFEYVYNALDLPVTQTRKSYYFSTLENTTLNIKYYYQGEIIPNN